MVGFSAPLSLSGSQVGSDSTTFTDGSQDHPWVSTASLPEGEKNMEEHTWAVLWTALDSEHILLFIPLARTQSITTSCLPAKGARKCILAICPRKREKGVC